MLYAIFSYLYPFRCPVGPSWEFQCNWAKCHSWHLCYLPWKTSHHCQWLLWSGILLRCGNSCHTLNCNSEYIWYNSNIQLSTFLHHRLLAHQRWSFASWLLSIHTTTPFPKGWRPSLWDLWFWSLDYLWVLTLAMLSILPETSDHVFSPLWLDGAVGFLRTCTYFMHFLH